MKDIGFPCALYVGGRCGTRRGSTRVSNSSVATTKVSVKEILPKKRTVSSLFQQHSRQCIPIGLALSQIRHMGFCSERKSDEADNGTITGIPPVPLKRELQVISANA